MSYYAVFDVGGTRTKFGLMTEDGMLMESGDYATDCTHLDLFLQAMVEVIRDFQQNWTLEGIAISLPGFVDSSTGYTEFAGAITALNRQNIKTLLEKKTALRVEVENDANCAALAEKFSGHGVDCQSFICMTIGTGIGGGIFVGGQLVRGATFRGGEFGMMLNESANGQFTTLNGSASTAGLIRSYKAYKSIPHHVHVDGKEVFEEAERDQAVQQLIDQWYKRLAIGIYNLATVLNPEKILIGGGVSIREDLIKQLHARLNALHSWKDIEVKIEPCKYLNQAGMIGALYHYLLKEKE
ncbi:ROK family protein [Bacillus sp. NPDC077027]|uniref:ROK family protein n=1 Tax=Bacillus sp. NPDC077027 TaxID=3390548 RepID=UPI003CFDFEB3